HGEQLRRARRGGGDEGEGAAGDVEAADLAVTADDELGRAVEAGAVDRDVPGVVDLEQDRVVRLPQGVARRGEVRRAVQVQAGRQQPLVAALDGNDADLAVAHHRVAVSPHEGDVAAVRADGW